MYFPVLLATVLVHHCVAGPPRTSSAAGNTALTVESSLSGDTRLALWSTGHDAIELSSVSISTRLVRLGGARLRIAGLGALHTSEQHRGQGYARQIMLAAIDHIRQSGFAMSILFGIGNFYERFGYTAVLDDWSRVLINPDDIRPERFSPTRRDLSSFSLHRPSSPDDLAAMAALYAEYNRFRSATAIRDCDTYWKGLVGNDGVSIICYAGGPIVGYFECSVSTNERIQLVDEPRALVVRDYAHAEGYGEVSAVVLHQLARICTGCGLRQIACALPADSPFAAYARRQTGSRVVQSFIRDREVMARMGDKRALLRAFAIELSRRRRLLAPGAAQSFTGLLIIRTFDQPEDQTALSFNNSDHVDVVDAAGLQDESECGANTRTSMSLPQDVLVSLILGATTVDAVLMDASVTIDDVGLVRAWFAVPNGLQPHVYLNDKY
jgi:Acetyltransferase (GNAT) domain